MKRLLNSDNKIIKLVRSFGVINKDDLMIMMKYDKRALLRIEENKKIVIKDDYIHAVGCDISESRKNSRLKSLEIAARLFKENKISSDIKPVEEPFDLYVFSLLNKEYMYLTYIKPGTEIPKIEAVNSFNYGNVVLVLEDKAQEKEVLKYSRYEIRDIFYLNEDNYV